MGMEIYLTQAKSGDCIIVRCGVERKVNLVIDSGQSAAVFEKALKRIEEKDEKIDLMIWTHDDNDHIKGACNLLKRLKNAEKKTGSSGYGKLLENITEERILFNFGGNGTEALLKAEDVKKLADIMDGQWDFRKLGFVLADEKEKKDVPFPNMIQLRWECVGECLKSEVIKEPTEEDLNTKKEHLEIVILSPTKENLVQYINEAWKKLNNKEVALKASGEKKEREWDRSIQYWMTNDMETGNDKNLANRASIAFLLIYEGAYTLFAGDASPDVMVSAGKEFLRRSGKKEEYMNLELIKLPHHGSSRNINMEFLQFFRTTNYLVSTVGNTNYQHPGKGTLAAVARVLAEGKRADIYSNYDWWRTNEAFCRAERRKGNWNSLKDTCELMDEEEKKKNLSFHKLKTALIPIGTGIFLAR